MKEKYDDRTLPEILQEIEHKRDLLAKERESKIKLVNKLQYLSSYLKADYEDICDCVKRNESLKRTFFLNYDVKVVDYQNFCLRDLRCLIEKVLPQLDRVIKKVHLQIDKVDTETMLKVHDSAFNTYRFSRLVIYKVNKLEDISEFLGGEIADFEEDLIREESFAKLLGKTDSYIDEHKRMLYDVFDDEKESISPLYIKKPNPPTLQR